MSFKIVTYDLSRSTRKEELKRALRRIGRLQNLNSNSCILHTRLNTKQVLFKLLRITDFEDKVYVMEMTKAWSGYGDLRTKMFLERHR